MPAVVRQHCRAIAILACSAWLGAQAPAPGSIRYGRDVRPILADKCFRCHGPDEATRAADLRLDQQEAARAPRDDGAAIVPFDPAASALWHRVTAEDPDERMPPPESGKPALTAAERAVLERWIREGAVYEPHWAFVPPVPAPLPGNEHPIDAFVHATLRERGLEPAPRADAATLARRAFLVLTGLPPLPAELDAFLADVTPGAYERLVDRLLDEEPYRTRGAEHFAGPWLDAARYADTSGIHMDAGRQIWPWRDWLLDALRTDLPFDRFVHDQIAGDLVPDATQAQKVASGFLRLHVTTDEGGAIDEEYRVEYAAERTAVVGSVMLGLTVGCARCHDHKYDPIRQEDYYRLFAFFNSNQEPGLYSQEPDSNRALEPFLQVPSDAQAATRTRLTTAAAVARDGLAGATPEERAAAATFGNDLRRDLDLTWTVPVATAATSAHGTTLAIQPDGSVLASGHNPPSDTHTIELHTDAGPHRWLCLSALADPSLPHGKVGRNGNGNAVLQHLRLEARPRGSDEPYATVPLVWATADIEQQNGDHGAANALDDDDRGWAMAAHQHPPGDRHALFLAAMPFGQESGADLRVTLVYDSEYPHHTLGRVRLQLGTGNPRVLSMLPLRTSGLHVAGPFGDGPAAESYAATHGPEAARTIDGRQKWDEGGWRFLRLGTDVVYGDLPKGSNATYVGQVVHSPDARDAELALGSDDGFQLFVNGVLTAERRIDRGLQPDQDRATFRLRPGTNMLVLKVVNTGGDGGFALRHVIPEVALPGDLALELLPESVRTPALATRSLEAHRAAHSPRYREQRTELERLQAELAALEAAIPRTMVMSEAAMPRPTFVLQRGEYDKPDPARPVARELPQVFGALPPDAPRDRRGLAQWLVSERNPLLLRVAMNRLWQSVFGTGIVRTSEDFGLQGEWPSHPELLDWLACEFRARGHSTKAMLRLLVTSATFCRSSARHEAAAAVDPDNRLLAWFPRQRLSAEAIRDQALFVAGLLVERTGGPSKKPRQPDGLWQEVAMPQSNTRTYVQDTGDDLWRRSLYVYWKRACPPPNLLAFDAPTREFCTIRRGTTNTPLQALVLWNDPQFVEAARVLAERTVREVGNPTTWLQAMYRACTGHALDHDQLRLALDTLTTLQQRFDAAPADAEALRRTGDAPIDASLPAATVAPFVVMASSFLSLDATLCID